MSSLKVLYLLPLGSTSNICPSTAGKIIMKTVLTRFNAEFFWGSGKLDFKYARRAARVMCAGAGR